jgi:hypothetical protein
MKNRKDLLGNLLFTVLLSACAPSASIIQTAIAQTQAAWTPVPLQMALPTYTQAPSVMVEVTRVVFVTPVVTTAPPTAAALPSINLAKGKKVTASSYWVHDETLNFPPANALDGNTVETNCTDRSPTARSYWLLAERQTGWIQIDLGKSYTITKVRWLNTHNGTCLDRATAKYHIALSLTDYLIDEETKIAEGSMSFSKQPTFQETNLESPVVGRYIRFYVDSYYQSGGGLNELEVYGRETC